MTAGSSSGTYNFAPSNSELVLEAFDRLMIRPSALTRHHWVSARRSLNFELQAWSNSPGVNLWEVVQATLTLVAGTATYALPTTLVTLLDTYYTIVDGGGTGINTDRLLSPLSRSQYAALPNKLQQGTPTSYWFQRLIAPQVTLWEVPQTGDPTDTVTYFYMRRIQDASQAGAETPNLPYRALDALAAKLAARLAVKFAPDKLPMLKAEAAEAWTLFLENDQEPAPVDMMPNVSSYWRM